MFVYWHVSAIVPLTSLLVLHAYGPKVLNMLNLHKLTCFKISNWIKTFSVIFPVTHVAMVIWADRSTPSNRHHRSCLSWQTVGGEGTRSRTHSTPGAWPLTDPAGTAAAAAAAAGRDDSYERRRRWLSKTASPPFPLPPITDVNTDRDHVMTTADHKCQPSQPHSALRLSHRHAPAAFFPRFTTRARDSDEAPLARWPAGRETLTRLATQPSRARRCSTARSGEAPFKLERFITVKKQLDGQIRRQIIMFVAVGCSLRLTRTM